MATSRLPLVTSNLPQISESEVSSSVSSPSRGKQMAAFIRSKTANRYPLNHIWDFWHDRQDRQPTMQRSDSPNEAEAIKTANLTDYENRLILMESNIQDVKHFWELFNNFDITKMPLKDSVHLFHQGIKPVWEDPRNVKGGSWTFRVPKEKAPQFWKEVCVMAVGDELQKAVASDRTTFRDDICGISLSVRFTSTLISIWNRDADHEEGIQKILETITSTLSPELVPRESAYYYKRHSDHPGFTGVLQSTADVKPNH